MFLLRLIRRLVKAIVYLVVLVLLVQCAAAGQVACLERGPVLLGVLWCAARCAAVIGLRRGVPAARADGLGRTFAGSVPSAAAAGAWVVLAAVLEVVLPLVGAGAFAGAWIALGTAAVVVVLVHRVVSRLGGIVGDALGASIELALAVLLVLALVAV